MKGLCPPAVVLDATKEYRSQQDVLGTFLRECCIMNTSSVVGASRLYGAFKIWCDDNGEKTQWSQRKFGMAMTERGVQRLPSNGTQYVGLEVQPVWSKRYEVQKYGQSVEDQEI
jgi:putative DNA primase/helicase